MKQVQGQVLSIETGSKETVMNVKELKIPVTLVFAALTAAFCGVSLGGELTPKITSGPTVKREGAKTTISFTVSAPTDVDVAILDGQGKVVRHLGAGVLGPNAPVPFKKGSLAQELAWDGKDDLGKKASGAAKVRVRLGMRAKFERLLGWTGQSVDGTRGLACGPDGTLYLIHGLNDVSIHRETTIITAHKPDGTYIRQLFPGPANLPAEKRKGWPRIKPEDGPEQPMMYGLMARCTYPGAVYGQRSLPVITKDGRLIALSQIKSNRLKRPDARGRRLLTIGLDGSVPENFLGKEIFSKDYHGFGHLALTPDEKTLYISGFYKGGKRGKRCNVVWSMPLDCSDKPKVLFGTMFTPGAGKTGLNDPQGIAVDKDGNVFVADYGNNRVVAFSPEGKFLDEIPVETPDQVRVSPKTGSIYVMCINKRKYDITSGHYSNRGHNWRMKKIVKFADLKKKTAVASLPNPIKGGYGGGALMAIDDSGDQPIVWFGAAGFYSKNTLKAIDRGSKLELVGEVLRKKLKKDAYFGFIDGVAVLGDKVYCRDRGGKGWSSPDGLTFDLQTGKPLGRWAPKSAKGRAENIYAIRSGLWITHPLGKYLFIDSSENTSTLRRYNPDGSPAPFQKHGQHFMPGPPYPDRHGRNTTCHVTQAGKVYNAVRKTVRAVGNNQAGDKEIMVIRSVEPDGTVSNPAIIEVQGAKMGSLCVDSRGNIYVGAQATPGGDRIPASLRKLLPQDKTVTASYSQLGSIIKFPPTGGKIMIDPAGKFLGHRQHTNKLSITGGKIISRGGMIPGKSGETGGGCACEQTCNDIDSYDRIFVADALRFSVNVIDTAGNQIMRIGQFGNMDSRGPGSPVPEPEVTFGYPSVVECAGDRILVADMVNRRVVCVRLEYAAQADCPVR